MAYAGFESGCISQRISCAQRIASPADFVRQHKSWPRRRCRSGAQNSSPRAVTGCRAAAVALPLRRGRATAAGTMPNVPISGPTRHAGPGMGRACTGRIVLDGARARVESVDGSSHSALAHSQARHCRWACSRRRNAPSIDLGLSSGTALVSKASARSGRGTGGRPVPRSGVH